MFIDIGNHWLLVDTFGICAHDEIVNYKKEGGIQYK